MTVKAERLNLDDLKKSYEQSLSCSIQNKYKFLEKDFFTTELYSKIAESNSRLSSFKIKFVFGNYNKGLVACRKGNLNLANSHFERGEMFLDGLNDQQKFLIETLILPIKSFYQYKSENYIKARELLNETIVNDFILVDKGYTILYAHIMQQIHNISRIEFRLENTSNGVLHISNLLQHFLSETIEPDSNYKSTILKTLPMELKEAMIFQFSNELIINIIRLSDIDLNLSSQLFNQVFDKIVLKENSSDNPSNVLQKLRILIAHFESQQYDEFYKEYCQFIANSSRIYDTWKFFVTLFMVDVSKKINQKDDLIEIAKDYIDQLRINPKYKKILL